MVSTTVSKVRARWDAWRERRPGWPPPGTSGLSWGLLFLYVLVITRAGWLADDAFVSFRASDNLIHGHGLTYNAAERVQAFTNPLWTLMVAVAYAITRDIYFTPLVLNIILSVGAVALLATRIGKHAGATALGIFTLCVSKAFVDYSTSGLENPCGFALLALFYGTYFGRRDHRRYVFWIFILGSSLAVNRLDNILLVLPPLVHVVVSRWSKSTRRQMACGALPLLVWEAFAIVYYGFPWPNTAYAKLNTAIPQGSLFGQGLMYLVDSANRDPVTTFTIGATLLMVIGKLLSAAERVPVASEPSDSPLPAPPDTYGRIATTLAVALYIAYVVRVGGDFMAGRFLACPLFVAVILFVRFVGPSLSVTSLQGLAALVAFMNFGLPPGPGPDDTDKRAVIASGIANERDVYQSATGLSSNLHALTYMQHPYYQEGLNHRTAGRHFALGGAGMVAFAAGPDLYLLNDFAIGDALLARLPFRPAGGWRIGHFIRALPEGYAETLESGRNVLRDPCMHELYEHVNTVIRGPIFRVARFAALVRMNLGSYDYLAEPGCAARMNDNHPR